MALLNSLFINSAIVKEQSPISGSVDNKLISPQIHMAQIKYILPVLGTDLYNKFSDDIKNNTNITGNYETLLEDYIIPSLIQFTIAELLPVMRLRFVNNAITVMNSEQSTGASYDDIKPIINKYLDMGEFYRQRLIDYLTDNSTLFPEYSSNTGSDLNPTTENYYPGLNIEGTTDSKNLQLKSVISAMGIKGTGIC